MLGSSTAFLMQARMSSDSLPLSHGRALGVEDTIGLSRVTQGGLPCDVALPCSLLP